ncbi:MAG: sensor domain-containing diguanylate cyclase [Gammaproteobacteria bacterium]|nr:MAG: sensor domain-containing diguanylate cyclase [Gammaproteobacteria bacterium]
MKPPEFPRDETERLRALHSLNILDTPPEERFDRLTRIARRLFDVPIALVSLIDENRQWFKSNLGLEVRETPREISFCGHAILGEEVFIIPDATADERFADNPLVVGEPGIRFYAGCPLRHPDGSRLGTLCIIDTKPRELSGEDIETLKDLASMAERELAAIQLATLDELTGISNRRGFMLLGQHTLSLCRRRRLCATLAYIDLDAFKQINDTLGHEEGDRVLAAFADRLAATCRESDIYARLGGDEFVILFVDATRPVAQEALDRLRTVTGGADGKEAGRGEPSFSYGLVEFDPGRHDSIEALVREADALMYQHKRSGSGQESADVTCVTATGTGSAGERAE